MANRFLTILTVALPLLSSCVEPIVMDPLEEMPVVVNCVLTREVKQGIGFGGTTLYGFSLELPTQKLYLYYAKRPSEKEYTSISDATVKVSGGEQTYYFEWNGECWTSSFLPVFEETYVLSIKLKDGKALSSTMVFPPLVGLEGGVPDFSHSYANNITTKSTYPPVIIASAFAFSVPVIGDKLSRNGEFINHEKSGTSNVWIFAKEGDKNVGRIITNHPGADNFNIINGSFDDFRAYNHLHSYIKTPFSTDYHSYLNDFLSASPVHKDYVRIKYDWNSPFFLAADFDYERMVPYDDPYGIDPDGDGFYPGLYIDTRYECYFMSDEYDAFLRELANKQIHADEMVNQFFSPDVEYSNIVNGKGCFGGMYHYSFGNNPQQYIQYYYQPQSL